MHCAPACLMMCGLTDSARLQRYDDVMTSGEAVRHRHGRLVHTHPHAGPHRHLGLGLRRSAPDAHRHDRDHGHVHSHGHEHGHSHGLVDRSIVRSREGVKAVAISLGVLGVTALAQVAIFALSSSVALLADLIHNVGDALTAVPLGIAFALRSFRAEKIAGLAVVLAIFVSACVALYEAIQRFIHPEDLTHLWVLAAAGVIGFLGNEVAAQVRLHAGRRLSSPALVADGNHARTDGFVSLGVVVSAALVAIGVPRADPVVGLAITVVIFKITWDSWRLLSRTEPGHTGDGT
jgi:Co/Zn/Cd efflux system component